MREIEQEIECAARSEAKVLLTGESGVGKEVVARLIHRGGRRHAAPFFAVNCAGVPDSLLESELFGHARGSFTGAHRDAKGWFEQADGGTLFLDEIGEMSARMQAALLRFLETGEIQRVGAERPERIVNVRIIAATNRNLFEQMQTQKFREDLYYRLNVIRVVIPPLRDRREDVPLLLNHFIRGYSDKHGLQPPQLLDETVERLITYSWPGNVRELKNLAERLVVRARGGAIPPGDLPQEIVGKWVAPAGTVEKSRPVSEVLFERMTIAGESFWSVVYEPFMARDLTRDELRAVVTRGLECTRGNYKMLTALFNIEARDYKRLLGFLRKYQCHMPFQKFRSASVRPARIDDQDDSFEKAV
jgi:DNA-binding NtrC family response regulator